MKSSDLRQVDYCMEALSNCLSKFKLSLNRELFKEMELPRAIFQYCLQIAREQFRSLEMVKCRINLFRIITIVGFDDNLDNYREKLKVVFENLNLSANNQNFFILIYDLRGIASQIDAGPVYRFFLAKILPMLKTIFGNLLRQQGQEGQEDRLALMKHSLKLCRALLENKSQRLSLTKTVPLSYELVSTLLPYWAAILAELNKQEQHHFEVEVPIACQLLRIFNELMRGSYINFYLLLVVKPGETEGYVLNLVKYMGAVFAEVSNYPKAFEQYVTAGVYIMKELSEFVMSFPSPELVAKYCDLFFVAFKLLQALLKEHYNGNSKNERSLDKLLDMLQCSLSYVKLALTHTHKSPNHGNACLFKSTHYNERLEMLGSLFEAALQELKALNIFNQLCKVIGLMVHLYPESYDLVRQRFRLNYAVDDTRLDMIYGRTNAMKEDAKELDPESFMGWVSEWLKEIDLKAQANASIRAEIVDY